MSSNFTCWKMCFFYLSKVGLQLPTIVSIATIPCRGSLPYYVRPSQWFSFWLLHFQLLIDLLLIPNIRSRFTTSLNQCFEQFCVYIDQIGFQSFLCSRSKCYCPSQWQPNRIKVDRRKLTLKRKKGAGPPQKVSPEKNFKLKNFLLENFAAT